MCGTASSLTAKFNIGAVPAFRLKQAFTRCPTNRQPVAHRNGIIQQRTTTIVRQSLPVPPRITCRQIWACLGSHRHQTEEEVTARYTRNLRGNLRGMKKALGLPL